MIDLINMLSQENGYEVAWDYCLENNLIMPSTDQSLFVYSMPCSSGGHPTSKYRNSLCGAGRRLISSVDDGYFRSRTGYTDLRSSWSGKSKHEL